MRKLLLVFLIFASSNWARPVAVRGSVLQETALRRVNAPYFDGQLEWSETAIFWFGKNEQGIPSRNYADVRVGYTADSLQVRVTVVDYYLWYLENATVSDDLTAFDAVYLYLDTGHDRSASPQADDYRFLLGSRHWPNEDAAQYRRQARGDGGGWDASWSGSWLDYGAMQWWCNPGPNSNECGIDYGWTGIFTVPWETLGRSGPPPEGSLWGLGVQLLDRDDAPPAGYVEPDHWPETFEPDSPATWGELHFGAARFRPPEAVPEGTTVIRAASPTDNTVEDAWMGGGGVCGSGHEGGTEINHGADTGLYVGSEIAPTHFPCFNKSYLRFALDAVPAGKTIISATMTLHLWGNAGAPGEANPSWVHLFTVGDPWDEMTIHWNNAPLPRENVAASWVYPLMASVDWPGVAYHWDTTQAVAEAYARGEAVSVAIYGSDTDQHSSKYLTSSETGDWNVAGRPALAVVWGRSTSTLQKSVAPVLARTGQELTYTLRLVGSGRALTLVDPLPEGVGAPGPIQATAGTASYNSASRRVEWTGTPDAGQEVTIAFSVTVTATGPLALKNTATLTDPVVGSTTASALVIANALRVHLPVILRH